MSTTPIIPIYEIPDLEEAPLWELGIGGGGTYTPDYPGSDQNHFWGTPFPFVIYRGDILHSDRRGGTRARILQRSGYELNLSFGGGLPSKSADNRARDGMPNLQWLGEIGPRITIDIFSNPRGSSLRLGLPLRAAFTSDFKYVRDTGYTFAPELLLDLPRRLGGKFDAYSKFSVTFADRRFHAYFYDVNPDYATKDRPEFTSRGGYLLSDLGAGITVPIKSLNLKFATYASVQSLHGAANQDSPLVRSKFTTSISMVLFWVFGKSETTVMTDD